MAQYDDAPCPDCGTPLGQVHFRDCLAHALYAEGREVEQRNADEAAWGRMDWYMKYEADPARAFADLVEHVEGLREKLRVQGG